VRLRRLDDRGTSTVELALVLPVVVMLLLGSITGGLALSTMIAASDAVREGARFGATALPSTTWGQQVVDQTIALSATELGPGQVCARLEKGGTVIRQSTCSFASAAPTPPTGVTGCVVLVWAQKSFTIDGGVVSYPGTMNRGSVARYERLPDQSNLASWPC
jgi:Flp pilus assembly protein TadG